MRSRHPRHHAPKAADLQAELRRARVRYRSIFENAIEGIFQTTSSGRYVSANPALARIYGYDSAAELIASLTDIARDLYVDSGRRAEFIRLLHERDTVQGFESQVRRHDGRIIWIVENARAVRDGDGELLYYEGTVEDISARKEAEEELQRSRRDIEENARISAALARVGREIISVLDPAPVVDRICDLTTEILGCDCSHILLRDASTAEYRVVAAHGYNPEQLETLRVLRLPETTLEAELEPFQRIDVVPFVPLENPTSQIAQLGLAYGITSGIHAVLRHGNEIIGIHGAGCRGATDPFTSSQVRIAAGMAQLTSLALENAALVEKLEQASRLKSDFVATMSHELRTPLHVILGYTELLLDGAYGSLSPPQGEALRRLDDHAHQLRELITTTLDLGRLDAGRLHVTVDAVHLHQLFAEVEGETRNLPGAAHLRFEWNVDPELPALRSDRLKLKVILKNLINNAVKFTLQGEVSITADKVDDTFEIEVRDTGTGITQEALPVIFEAFRQGDSSPTRRFDGAGLGLYIVQRLLEVLGGTIHVSSEPGKGSSFRIRMSSIP